MPRKGKRMQKKGKRTHRKNKGSPVKINVHSIGFPDEYVTSLYFSDNGNYTGAGGTGLYVFRGNSVYDPDETGGGGQPTYFDQLMTIYKYFCVTSSKISLEMISLDANGNPLLFTIVPLTSATVTSADLTEYPHNKTMILTNQKYGALPKRVSSSITTRKILGLQKNNSFMISDDTYNGTASANPTNTWKWYLAWTDFGVGSTSSIYMRIKITYHVTFRVKLNVADS